VLDWELVQVERVLDWVLDWELVQVERVWVLD
jgi:hypothetical protein